MKVNLSQPIPSYSGEPLRGDDGEEIIFEGIIGLSLTKKFRDEKISDQESWDRFKLAQRIAANPEEVELSTNEANRILKSVAAKWGPDIYGPVRELIGQDHDEDKED